MIYEIEGIVYRIGDEWKNDTGTFSKMPLILLVTEFWNEKKYESFIEFDFIGEAMHLLGPVELGYKVSIRFVLNGRLGKDKYEGRAFTTLKAIKIEVLESSTVAQGQASIKADEVQSNVQGFVDNQGGASQGSSSDDSGASDLPF